MGYLILADIKHLNINPLAFDTVLLVKIEPFLFVGMPSDECKGALIDTFMDCD